MRRLVAISLLAATAAFAQNEDSSDESGSPGVVTLVGIDESSFNSNRSPHRVGFALAGETYDPDPTTLRIFLDGEPQDSAANDIAIQPQLISVTLPPTEHSDLHFLASDSHGRTIDADFSYWAGSHTVRVRVSDAHGAPVAGAAVITKLSQDPRISSETTTDAEGVAEVGGLPACCVSHEARGPDGGFDAIAISPRARPDVALVLRGFESPSGVDNNDFRLGSKGWQTGSASVSIIPHQEDPSGDEPSEDHDMAICTDAGSTPRTVSRTFRVAPGTKEITVRYRLVTSEAAVRRSVTSHDAACDVWFSVDLRAQTSGRTVHETYTVSGLGAAAFTAIESTQQVTTQWREARLVLDPVDDVVQVDLTTAHADASCEPDVVVDNEASDLH
jgi:hypothetical protein